MRQLCVALFAALLSVSNAFGQCAGSLDRRTDKKSGIIVENVVLSGTRALDSSEMSGIVSQWVGSCFDENAEELGLRLRLQFQQRGYMQAKVEHVTLKPSDQLAVPKPVTLEADVTEGPRYRFGELRFEGNRAFSAEELAKHFPMKPGEIFNSQHVLGGLNALRQLYGPAGYIDVVMVPQTLMRSDDEPTVTLKLTIQEGQQYHMGKLDIAGPREPAARLQTRWSLAEGAPFDATYPHRFVEDNRELLPAGFQERASMRILRDCRDATVTVLIVLDPLALREAPRETGCEKPAAKPAPGP